MTDKEQAELDILLRKYLSCVGMDSDSNEDLWQVKDKYGLEADLLDWRDKARLEENGWTRRKIIVMKAGEAPNSGFGRMCNETIRMLNERKLALLRPSQRPADDTSNKSVSQNDIHNSGENIVQRPAEKEEG